jgi:hypothetical protein
METVVLVFALRNVYGQVFPADVAFILEDRQIVRLLDERQQSKINDQVLRLG